MPKSLANFVKNWPHFLTLCSDRQPNPEIGHTGHPATTKPRIRPRLVTLGQAGVECSDGIYPIIITKPASKQTKKKKKTLKRAREISERIKFQRICPSL